MSTGVMCAHSCVPVMKGPMEESILSGEPTLSMGVGLFTPSLLSGATINCTGIPPQSCENGLQILSISGECFSAKADCRGLQVQEPLLLGLCRKMVLLLVQRQSSPAKDVPDLGAQKAQDN